ncbi:Tetraspanin family [Popillia japonica]|uniref:Tetraspanin n=1 Tax=Popillia japonica TaxID=7064 RepID=A0AAW1NKT0_POPJA
MLLFMNIITWMLATAIFALCLWIRFEPGFQDWIEVLEIQVVYIGPYILTVISAVVMIVSFLGCLSSLQESSFLIFIFIGTQLLVFVGYVAGTAILLNFTTKNSAIQPIIRESMRRLIMNKHYQKGQETLALIQEHIGCCGADGPDDYIFLRQPLPSQCRDTVTGNAFFHGCVEEMTWFFEEKCAWIAALAMTNAMIHIINVVMSFILTQAIRKEENEAETYRR